MGAAVEREPVMAAWGADSLTALVWSGPGGIYGVCEVEAMVFMATGV